MSILGKVQTIAGEELDLQTLETRNSDSLDFSDQAVWCIRKALLKAYKAGVIDASGDIDQDGIDEIMNELDDLIKG